MFELGSSVPTPSKLRDAAAPWLQKAHEATHMTVHLAVLDGSELVYVDIVASLGMTLPSRIGGRMPAVCTGLGKVMLAHANTDELEEALSGPFRGPITYMLSSEKTFVSSLSKVREDGFVVHRSERVTGVSCIAAPVRGSGRALGAISLAGPTANFQMPHLKRVVQSAARNIWSEMFAASRG
jgi:DNA-binding IclR family transcriptional regulator